MQVCITGANGFIGRALVDALSRQGHTIRILTRRTETIFPRSIEVITGDLSNPSCALGEFLKGCDVLYHCAGEIHDVSAMRMLHVDGTNRLLQAALAEYSCQKALGKAKMHWVQLSSCGAYGPPTGSADEARTVTEITPTCPSNEYESTKTESDELLMGACNNGTMSYSILRPANVFGPTMPDQSLRKLIKLVKGGHFFFLGKAGAVTTYVHVNDVVVALITLATNPRAKGEIFNLSSDCTMEDLISKIAALLQVREPRLRIPSSLIRTPLGILASLLKSWVHVPKLDALVLRTRYPASKIESELGFKFAKPMPNAIEDLTREYC